MCFSFSENEPIDCEINNITFSIHACPLLDLRYLFAFQNYSEHASVQSQAYENFTKIHLASSFAHEHCQK